MPLFTIHTAESAPAGSKEPLALLEQRIGFVPNLAGTMAGLPTLIGSFVGLQQRLQASSLTGLEREAAGGAARLHPQAAGQPWAPGR